MVRLIKKYKNRKLYDTSKSEFITLFALERLIHKGEFFNVVDHEGKDITATTLTEALVKQVNRLYFGEVNNEKLISKLRILIAKTQEIAL